MKRKYLFSLSVLFMLSFTLTSYSQDAIVKADNQSVLKNAQRSVAQLELSIYSPSGSSAGYFSGENPVFVARFNTRDFTIVKYEWTVNGSTSIRQSGSYIYVTTYPGCGYLSVILTVTLSTGEKVTVRDGFSRL